MTRRTQWLFLGLLVPAALAADAPGITVHLFNLAGAPEPVLTQAVQVATGIYAKAGVPLRWVRQPEAVARLANGQPFHHEESLAEMSIWLMPRPAAGQFAGASKLVSGMADTGPRSDSRYMVTVLYDRVERSAGAYHDLQLPELLGIILAHELGHLFLGPGAHEKSSIMTPRWEKEDFRSFLRGQLTFSPAQAAKLRSNAAARIESLLPNGTADLRVDTPGSE